MQFIGFCYNKAFGHNFEELFFLREKLEFLFDEYALKLDHSTSPSTSKKKDKGKAPHGMEVDESDLLKEFDDVSSDLFYASNQKSQLELYLDEPRMKWSYQLDILFYWKTNQCRYPILAAMACDILCIPVSIVASEAAFSVGGRALDQFRSSLKHDIVVAIVCTRDWLYGNEDGFKVLHQDMDDLINNVVDLNIQKKKMSTKLLTLDVLEIGFYYGFVSIRVTCDVCC